MSGRLPAPTDLSPLIAQADALRIELGYSRFSHLSAWCDDGSPLTCDAGALERLIERLCVLWVERQHYHG
ncbi:hypothetical protein GFS31_24310 [Leptolyngbya sp. BL0902]|uniref:hypothetical protein n=1 Tax=Leptolyngbya sp. BL0902 TaxID=1115757 RepID=UPI0018E7BE9B|nr:hypothetical protein [Leptolyngbya sp. BL0902]QQE65743.1 hypothetical protein GFS31_24310 [Leptolyngbya sp. BL0902]